MICNQHKIEKQWRQVTFEYCEDGITVRVPGIHAWVCPEDQEPAFTPSTVDELFITIRELVEIAKRARVRKSVLTEYIVSISTDERHAPIV